MCGHCLAVCPTDSIIIDGDGYDCEDVEDLSFTVKPNSVMMRNMILSRRSVRYYTDDPVTDEEIEKILEAGKYSPTAMNVQGNAFLVVRDPDNMPALVQDTIDALDRLDPVLSVSDPSLSERQKQRKAVYEEKGVDKYYFNAPVVIFVFADNDIDGAIAATTMGFMAQSLQLGVTDARFPARAFMDSEMREKWGAPEDKVCTLALLIGNPEPEFICSVPRKNPVVIMK